jgi:hypothetical protein
MDIKRDVCRCGQIANTWSTHLCQRFVFIRLEAVSSSSKSVMASKGEGGDAMAAPSTCLWNFSLCTKNVVLTQCSFLKRSSFMGGLLQLDALGRYSGCHLS